MKSRIIFIASFLTIVLSGLFLTDCKRKKEEFIGPEYMSAPDGFTGSIVSLSNNVNFTTSNCVLEATFSHQVTYIVTYKGLSSGAVKSFTSINNKINAGDIGNIWNGGHDGVVFFRSGEQVELSISFFKTDFILKDTITVATKRNFFSNTNYLPVYTANNGYEGVTANNFPGQFYFLSTNPCTGTSTQVTDENAPEGLKCFKLESTSCQADGYFIGGMQHRKTGFYMPADWTDPSKVYFNIYVKGTGNKNGRLSLEFGEADESNDATKPKLDCDGQTVAKGEHDPCSDDGWGIQVPLDHTGWKLVSVKFSDMAKGAGPNIGGNGNGKKEPTRIHRIQIGVLSVPTPKEQITAIWDFPVLSYGGPFDPSK